MGGQKGVKVKKFLLEIPEEIWNKWKDTVPRSISLNKEIIITDNRNIYKSFVIIKINKNEG